jgi:hypothetical protein
MTAVSIAHLALALVVGTGEPAARRDPVRIPSAAELTPIEVPSVPARQSAFADELRLMCGALASSPSKEGVFSPDELLVGAVEARQAAAAKLKATCDRLSGGAQLTEGDLSALRAIRRDPTGVRSRLQSLTASRATPQTDVSSPPASSASLEAALINGLAQFIYDRAKVEAEAYAANRLGALLCDKTEVAPFFSHLCVVLQKQDTGLSLSAVGTFLGAAARKDLQRLPDVALIYGAAQLDEVRDPGGSNRRLLFGARLGLASYFAVASGRNPLDVARSLHAIEEPSDEQARRVLASVAFASELIDAVMQQRGWQKLASGSPSTLDLGCFALGALFTLDELDGSAPISKTDLKVLGQNLPLVAQLVVDVASLNARLERAITDMAAPPSGAGGDFGGATPQRRLSVKDYVLLTTQALDRTVQDGVSLAHAMGVLDDAGVATAKSLRAALELGELIVEGDLPGAALAAVEQLEELTRRMAKVGAGATSELFGALSRLAPIVSQLAQAHSADEVAAVLQAAAAPASAYKNKYKSPTVALNALVGVALGKEGVRNGGTRWGDFVGAFAPVGVHATTPVGDSLHVGALISVINLGALVSARFDADTSKTPGTIQSDPNVSFSNVLSPGAFLTLGLFGSPFLLGAGAQVVPASRQIVTADASGGVHTSSAAGVQVLGFLSVDVPLFAF